MSLSLVLPKGGDKESEVSMNPLIGPPIELEAMESDGNHNPKVRSSTPHEYDAMDEEKDYEEIEKPDWSISALHLFPIVMALGLALVSIVAFVPVYVLWSDDITTLINVLVLRVTDSIAALQRYEISLLPATAYAIAMQVTPGRPLLRLFTGLEWFMSSLASPIVQFPEVIRYSTYFVNDSYVVYATVGQKVGISGAFATDLQTSIPAYFVDNSSYGYLFPLLADTVNATDPNYTIRSTGSYQQIAVEWYNAYQKGEEFTRRWNPYEDVYGGNYFTFAIPFVDEDDRLGLIETSLFTDNAFAKSEPLFGLLRENGRAWLYAPDGERIVLNSWGQEFATRFVFTTEDVQFKVLTVDTVNDRLVREVMGYLKARGELEVDVTGSSGAVSTGDLETSLGKVSYYVTSITDQFGLRLLCISATLQSDFTRTLVVVRIVLPIAIVLFVILTIGAIYVFTRIVTRPLVHLVLALRMAGSLKVSTSDIPTVSSRITDVWAIQRAHARLVSQLAQLRSYVPQAVLASLEDVDDEVEEGKEGNPGEVEEGARGRRLSGSLEGRPVQRPILNEPLNVFYARSASVLVVDCMWTETSIIARRDTALTPFFRAVREVTSEHGGIVESLRPDRIVVSFNAHVPLPMHASSACQCACAIFHHLNENVQQRVTIAVDTGEYQVGACGTQSRSARVVLGGNILTALVDELRRIKSPVGVTWGTASHLPDLRAYPVECVQLPRSSEPMMLYELLAVGVHAVKYKESGASSIAPERARAICGMYRQGMSAMRSGDYATGRVSLLPLSRFDPQARRLVHVCDRRLEKHDTSPYVHLLTDAYVDSNATLSSSVTKRGSGAANAQSAMDSPIGVFAERSVGTPLQTSMTHMDAGKGDMSMSSNESTGALFELASMSPSDTESTPTANDEDTLGGPPIVVVDRNGTRWKRSLNKISFGAFSEVFLGISEGGEQVALKCIPRRRRDVSAESLESEVDVASRLRHPNIVRYVSYAMSAGYLTLVMEYVPGGSLAGVIESFGGLTPTAARRFTTDVLRGLRYLHARGIVHCDVKPHNMLLGTDGVCKLTDFGSTISEATDVARAESENVVLRGTAIYMSPEVARGERCTPQSDIFSLGVSLVEMLTGQLPWVWTDKAKPGSEAKDLNALLRRDVMFAQALGRGEITVAIPTTMGADVVSFARACCQDDSTKRPTAQQLQSYAFLL